MICCYINTVAYCKGCSTRLCEYHLEIGHYIHAIKVHPSYNKHDTYYFCPVKQRLITSGNPRWPGESHVLILDVSLTSNDRDPEIWEWLKPKET